ncbi:hypothetical protein AGMMS4952_01390 [Spirochaetia bacterium]|nr:hypothetical protein AGMMS4952_01390 [Spirochaetia bacterium]
MTRKIVKILTPLIFLFTAACIVVLYFMPPQVSGVPGKKQWQARVVIPRNPDPDPVDNGAERMVYEDSMNAKVALNEGESIVAVLTQDMDGDMVDEQILAFRQSPAEDSPVFITYIDFDEERGYSRLWSASTAVTRPGTASVYVQDLIGDRSLCILVNGMNSTGEQTLTVFQKPAEETPPGEISFIKIAELRTDGSIQVQETERTQAYQKGLAKGESFTLATYGRDPGSTNILDQVELIYTYNAVNRRYEQSRMTRIPGSQIETRRVQEVLSGGKEGFEQFITGLWYYVSPQGTLDSRQYIYFDPGSREIIFYGEEIQQVFTWQNSSATRRGLYVSSQNISVTTLRRFLDIELESPDSIRVKVFEDVRLKIYVTAPWDGSYRKAAVRGPAADAAPAGMDPGNTVPPYIDASYDGSIGRMVFSPDGNYELYAGGTIQKRGRYAFFMLDNQELLELRPRNSPALTHETYRVDRGGDDNSTALTLTRIRLGTRGVRELHEAAISLVKNMP